MKPAFLFVKNNFQIAAPEWFSTNKSDLALTLSRLADSWNWFTRFHQSWWLSKDYATNQFTGQ